MFYWFGFAVFESIFLQITEITIYKWNKFIMLENRFHTTIVRRGFKLGFFLFIISEIFFFFGFFWAFFHSSLSPSIQIGGVWPPINIEFLPIDGFAITNTVVLLSSGVTITLAHHFIMLNNKIIFKFVKLFLFKKRIIIFLFLTLILALIFLICQFFEYCSLSISINSGIYGSTFFMITGLHGIHVFIGFCFLTYCLLPITPIKFKNCFINLFKVFLNLEIINFNQLNWINIKTENWNYGSKGIESFECAAWYWHFVDVVWLFVFGFIYIWSHIGIL